MIICLFFIMYDYMYKLIFIDNNNNVTEWICNENKLCYRFLIYEYVLKAYEDNPRK